MERKSNSSTTTATATPFNCRSQSLLYDPDANADDNRQDTFSQSMTMSEEMMVLEMVHAQRFLEDEEKHSEFPRSESLDSSDRSHCATFHSYHSATYHSDKSPGNLSVKSTVSLGSRHNIVDPSTTNIERESPKTKSPYSRTLSLIQPPVQSVQTPPAAKASASVSPQSCCNDEDTADSGYNGMSSSNETGCSRFDGEKHCRYCYSYLSEEHNSSSCCCNGLLCRDCLQRELTISWNRALNRNQWDNQNRRLRQLVPTLACTVCKFQYPVTRSKLEIETSWREYIRYFVKKTFPKSEERDLSVFDGFNHGAFNAVYLLPIDTANTMMFFLGLWIGVTLLLEGVGGAHITDGRVMCFLLDSYLMIEITRITEFLDFPERVWILIIYLVRSFVYCGWAVMAYSSDGAQFAATASVPGTALPSLLVAHRAPKKVLAHFNCWWLIVLTLFSWAICGYELHQYCRDILRRALREEKDKIRVSITSKQGKEYQFTLPNPGRADNGNAMNADLLREGAPDRINNPIADVIPNNVAPPDAAHVHEDPVNVFEIQAEGI